MTYRTIISLTLAWCVAWITPGTLAQDNVQISNLTIVDRQYMEQARTMINDLAAQNFGSRLSGNQDNDLSLLQRLLDKHLVRPDQTLELQAMGVVMGDLLAADLDMHWVIYEDRVGRSRALRYKDSAEYLFPATMISRRQEADNHTPVAEIYQKAHAIIAQRKPALPFQ